MPPAVPLIAAAAGAAASAAIGTGLLASLGGAVVATGLNFLGSRLLASKPKAPSFSADAGGRSLVIRSSVESHKVIYGTARVSGPLVYAATVDTGPVGMGSLPGNDTGDNKFLHLVIPLAGHEVEEIGDIYLNDQRCTLDANGFVNEEPYNYQDGNGIRFVRVRKHLGSPDQEAAPDLIAEVPGWTAAHRLRGIAYLYVRLHWNPNVFPQGIPNISAVVKGKKVYDPRTGLTAWSDNAALCARDYLASDYGFNCDDAEIEDAYFSAAANVGAELVAKVDGSLQSRYACDGVLDTASAPLDNLAALLTSLAGAVTYVQGRFRLHAAAYDSPAGGITIDDLAGELQYDARPSRSELFNAVRGTYVDPGKGWQPTDFPPLTSALYESEDGGERIFKDIELPFTVDPEAAQRIAKIILEKGRQGIRVTIPAKHTALQFAVYDVVTLTSTEDGWSAKPFRIMNWSLNPGGGITLQLQEESEASYAWNAGEASTFDAAPDTNLPNPFDVAPPGAPAIAEQLYAALDGSAARVKAIVTWAASPDVFVRTYQVEFRAAADTAWTVAGQAPDTRFEILDVSQGVYEFRVKAINSLGVSSAYASNPSSISGLSTPPASIAGFSLNAIHNNAHLSWDQSADIDVRIGGRIRLRYSKLTTGATWSGAVDLGPALPGVATQATVPLLDGTYLIKAVDSSGNESVSATAIVSTIANIVKMNTILTVTQDPGFAGAKTNMVVSSSVLKLDGTTLFDDVAGDFDAAAGYFDSGGSGGFAPYGEYVFDYGGNDYVDVGKVVTCRLTASIKSDVVNELDTFDQRGGLFDDALGLFDGDDLTGVDVKLYVRTTDDDPSGTPSWSDWRQFFVGDYTARAFQFKLTVQSNDAALNAETSELAVTIDMPDVTDAGSLTTGTGGRTTVSFNKDFYASPKVGGTILDAATGDYFDIQNVDADGFEIGVKDSGGSYVARSVHWAANGY
jgi:hypothetical protein